MSTPTAAALRILVVDDDAPLRDMLARSFTREGHTVTAVGDGQAALEATVAAPFDIILLDVALGPGLAGHDVARELRNRRNVVPIIMLTALDSEADIVLGLEAGADDYVTKPFGLGELRSRIRAVMRRAHGRLLDENVIQNGDVLLNRRDREVQLRGEPVKLTFSEYELLQCLMSRPGTCSTGRSCCGRSGATAPIAIHVPSTSTSATSGRSSKSARSSPRSSSRSGGRGTGSAGADGGEPRRGRRGFGLRPRLLLALVATAAVTLGAAALALLSPLQDRLERQAEQSLRTAVITARPQLNDALRESRGQLNGEVLELALALYRRTGSRVILTDATPAIDPYPYDTGAGPDSPGTSSASSRRTRR